MEKRSRRPVSRKPVGSGESPGLSSGEFSVTLDPSSTLPSPYANAYRSQTPQDPYSTPSPPSAGPSGRSPFDEYTGDQFFESVQSFPAQAPGSSNHDFRQAPRLHSQGNGLAAELPPEEPLRFTDDPVPNAGDELNNLYSDFHFSQSSFGTADSQVDPHDRSNVRHSRDFEEDDRNHGESMRSAGEFSHQRGPSGDIYPLNFNRQTEAFDIYDSYGDGDDAEVHIEQATAVRVSNPQTPQESPNLSNLSRDTSSGNITVRSAIVATASITSAGASQFSSPTRSTYTPRSPHSPQTPRSPQTPVQTSPVMPETPKEHVLDTHSESPVEKGARDEKSLGIGTGSKYVKYIRSSAGRAYSNKQPARLPIGIGPNKQAASYTVPKEFLRRALNIRYTHLRPRMLASEIDDDDGTDSTGVTGTSTPAMAPPLGPESGSQPGTDSRRSSSSDSVVEEIGRIRLFVANPDSDDD